MHSSFTPLIEIKPKTDHAEVFSAQAARLEVLTFKIQELSKWTALLTTAAGVSVVVLALGKWSRFPWSYEAPLFFLVVLTFLSIAGLILRDLIIKDGESLFEELSDEWQWRIARVDQETGKMPHAEKPPPPIEIRYVLRRFARSTNLPLVPGGNGAAVYTTWNLMILGIGIALSWLGDSPLR